MNPDYRDTAAFLRVLVRHLGRDGARKLLTDLNREAVVGDAVRALVLELYIQTR